MTLDDARLFVAVAHAASLSAAARSLGLSPAATSAGLKRIEARLDLRLVRRSTRAMELTAEGQLFLNTCEALLDAWAEGERALRAARDQLHGGICIAAPADLAHQYLAVWLGELVDVHPTLHVTLLVSDSQHRLPSEGVDVAIRYGALDDSSLVAARLCGSDRVPVASPAYLDRAGRPTHPRELRAHATLAWLRRDRPHVAWPLERDGERFVAEVTPHLIGDGAIVRAWALAGRGIACKSRVDVAEDLSAGRLEEVLPGWRGEDVPVYAVLPAGRMRTARVSALIEHLRARMGALAARV